MEWRHLPPEIQQRMLDEQERQGNPRNPDVFINYLYRGSSRGGFTWSESIEGKPFWQKVLENEDIEQFFDLYPRCGIKAEFIRLYKRTFRVNRIPDEIDRDAVKEKGLEHILL